MLGSLMTCTSTPSRKYSPTGPGLDIEGLTARDARSASMLCLSSCPCCRPSAASHCCTPSAYRRLADICACNRCSGTDGAHIGDGDTAGSHRCDMPLILVAVDVFASAVDGATCVAMDLAIGCGNGRRVTRVLVLLLCACGANGCGSRALGLAACTAGSVAARRHCTGERDRVLH